MFSRIILLNIIFVLSLSTESQSQQIIGVAMEFNDQVTDQEKRGILSDYEFINTQGFGITLALENGAQINTLERIARNNSAITYYSSIKASNRGTIGVQLSRFFVKLSSDTDLEQFIINIENENFQFESEYPYIKGVYMVKATKNSTGFPLTLKETLLSFEGVIYASQNSLFTPEVSAVNDPLFNTQWGINNDGVQSGGTADADMDVEEAWGITTGESHVRVAIIDSGTDTLHPDLSPNLLLGFDAINGTSKGYPSTLFPNDGHGTATAGIVAAVGDNGIGTAGVAYGSRIFPVKIFFYINFGGAVTPFSSNQSGSDGINWATDIGYADVLSNSWGLLEADMQILNIDTTFSNDVIRQAIKRGRSGKGLIALFSSGNENDTFSIWPAILPQTVSVGATSMCDERKSPTDCSFENWGGNYNVGLDVSAPGVKISTSDMVGNLGYNNSDNTQTFNGTSAACPNAAAVAALIIAIDSSFTGDEVREILSKSCDKVGGYDYSSIKEYGQWSKNLGYGRINAHQAVLRAEYTSNGINKVTKNELELNAITTNGAVQLIFISELSGDYWISVFNTLGQQISNELITLMAGQKSSRFIDNIQSGAYSATLKNKTSQKDLRFIIQ